MQELLEFDADGTAVLVQVGAGQLETGRARASTRRADGVVVAGRRFEDVTSVLRPAAEALIRHVSSLSVLPDEVSVDLGLSMSVSAGAFIASSAAEANFVIRMTWHPRRSQAAGGSDGE